MDTSSGTDGDPKTGNDTARICIAAGFHQKPVRISRLKVGTYQRLHLLKFVLLSNDTLEMSPMVVLSLQGLIGYLNDE